MGDTEGGTRLVAACEGCGSVYAAIELSTGDVRPIGSRNGCASCGETEFTPLSRISAATAEADD